jgi:hypothetical protein
MYDYKTFSTQTSIVAGAVVLHAFSVCLRELNRQANEAANGAAKDEERASERGRASKRSRGRVIYFSESEVWLSKQPGVVIDFRALD